MTDTYEIIYGACEQDMFDGPGPNHRTYRAGAHWYTGTESWDNAYACSPECKDALLAEFGGYRVGADDLPSAIVDLAVRNEEDGRHLDATVYELDVPSIATEQLPAVCGHCKKVMRALTLYRVEARFDVYANTADEAHAKATEHLAGLDNVDVTEILDENWEEA